MKINNIKNPLISIIIVNWNGKKWLKNCFNSLSRQTFKDFEILLIDNNSTDDSVDYIEANYPEIIIIKNTENRGFAGGNNDALNKAKGKYLYLLNNDTIVANDCLEKLSKAFDELPQAACIQTKLIMLNDRSNLDLVGAFWTNSTFLYYYGMKKDVNALQYNRNLPVFSNKGASVLIRRDVINKVGLFDDDFWCYYEETDFCHRLWLAGYECWYYPKAVVYHAGAGTTIRFDNSVIQYHNFKNKLLSFIKNFEIKNLLIIIPIYISLNVLISLYWLYKKKPKHFLALYKSIWWNIVNLSKTLDKRKKVQALRKVSDKYIFNLVKVSAPLSYYISLVTGNISNQDITINPKI